MKFDAWLTTTPRESSDIEELRSFVTTHAVNWPSEGADTTAHVAAVEQSDAEGDLKENAIKSLKQVWPEFIYEKQLRDVFNKDLASILQELTEQRDRIDQLDEKDKESSAKLEQLTAASTVNHNGGQARYGLLNFFSGIGSWGSALIAFVILFGIWALMTTDGFIASLADTHVARGMIGFLFAIGTIGIALLSVVAVFASSSDKPLEDRFAHGKDILTILIGVFGTIVGFYFGQASVDPNRVERPGASAGASASEGAAAGGPVEPLGPQQ